MSLDPTAELPLRSGSETTSTASATWSGAAGQLIVAKRMKTPSTMPEDIRQTPLFKKLLADAPAIEADFHAFKRKYQDLWETDHEAKVVVLQCHLILEAFLTDYLQHANPAATRIGDMRLSFAQKADLAYNRKTNFAFLMEGIKALNTLRNRLAHRLAYAVTDDDISPMARPLKIWHDAAGKAMPEGLSIVTTFTELACGFLDGTVQSINRHGGGAGLSGLIDWYAEDQMAEQSLPADAEDGAVEG